jgi:hypothetical protein
LKSASCGYGPPRHLFILREKEDVVFQKTWRFLFSTSILLALIGGMLFPTSARAAISCPTGGFGRAALVVDNGTQTTTYCVALDASSVTGVHLVQLAGSQFGLDYELGFSDEAVCRLGNVGDDSADCFASYPLYWGYFHGACAEGWLFAPTGPADFTVHPGDIEGWAWGVDDVNFIHPAPPIAAISALCTAPPPSISSIAPLTGYVGGSVSIFGSNLAGASSVTFNGVSQPSFTVDPTGTVITAAVPNGASTGAIQVTTSTGTATSVGSFVVTTSAHERNVMLSLHGHLRVKGKVVLTDGYAACSQDMLVRIQRRISDRWHTIVTDLTGTDGSFTHRLPDRTAWYRATVDDVTLANGEVCNGATSGTTRHHGSDRERVETRARRHAAELSPGSHPSPSRALRRRPGGSLVKRTRERRATWRVTASAGMTNDSWRGPRRP